MADLSPFRALRPVPAVVADVAAVPYDVVSGAEATALAAGNPLSFLRVSRAEIELGAEVDVHGEAVYARAAQNLVRLRAAAPLVVEDRPSLYVYRLRMHSHIQTGVAGCFSLDEYDAGRIKRHEKTRADKEDDRTRHLMALGAQTGPVLLTFRRRIDVSAAIERATQSAPLFDFAAVDGVQHTVWQASAAVERDLVAAFGHVPTLYIADGHHRAASASRARRTHHDAAADGLTRTARQRSEWDTLLAVAFPDDQMLVLPYNRVVRDLGRHTPDSLMDALAHVATVQPGPPVPTQAGHVSMFLQGRWHTIVLPSPPPSLAADAHLDVSRLQATVLEPLLGIGDPRADPRIDFVGGARGASVLETQVQSGAAAVAFSMYPVSVDELMRISDAGGIMPPKSTWFEPKLRDGVLSHVLAEVPTASESGAS